MFQMKLSQKHLFVYIGIIVAIVLISLYFYCRNDTRKLFPSYFYEHFTSLTPDVLKQLSEISALQNLSANDISNIVSLVNAAKQQDIQAIQTLIPSLQFLSQMKTDDIPKIASILRTTVPELKSVSDSDYMAAVQMAQVLLADRAKNSTTGTSIEVVERVVLPPGQRMGAVDEDKSNYITNGSFTDGRHIEQRVLSEGSNDIVVFPNPGKSSYVLRQSSRYRKNPQTNKDEFQKTFYQMQIRNLLPERSYYLRAYVYQSPDWNGKDYLFNVMMNPAEPTFLGDQIIQSGDGTIIANSAPIEGRVWNLVEYDFTTPKNFDGTAQIYIGFNPDNTSGYRYVTDLVFRQFLEFARNFPVSNKLQLFLSGSNPNSFYGVGTSWKDLSGSGNDMQFNQKPKWDPKTGQFSLEGFQGSGATGFRLLNPPLSESIEDPSRIRSVGNSFTLMIDPMRQKLNQESQVDSRYGASFTSGTPARAETVSEYGQMLKKAANPDNIVLKETDRILLLVRGNQDIALAVIWPLNTDYMKIIVGDRLYQTPQTINPELPLVYTFQYGGDGHFKVFQDASLIFDQACPRLYFSNDDIELNPTRLFTGLLRNIIFFNRPLNLREIDEIIQYVREHTTVEADVLDIRPNISNYMVSVPTNLPAGLNNVSSQPTGTPAAAQAAAQAGTTTTGDSVAKEIADLQKKLSEKEAEIKRQTDLIMNREENRNLTGDAAEAKRKSVEEMIRNQVMGDPQTQQMQKRLDELKKLQSCDTSLGPNCPKVTQSNGKYVIDAPAGSAAAQKFGRTGAIDLGSNKEAALQVYRLNFPDCVKMPDILDGDVPKPAGDSCPFLIMSDMNPCRSGSCSNVNWSLPPNQQFMNDTCKQSIRHYCEAYGSAEGAKGQACYCWGEGKDTADCRAYRDQFSGDTCNLGNQSIEKHPDASKYIRKDLVSSVCASCPLDSYQTAQDPRDGGRDASFLQKMGVIFS